MTSPGPRMQIGAQVGAETERPQQWVHAEQRLYEISPLGPLATTAVFFLVLIGSYAIAAAIDHHAWLVQAGGAGLRLERRAWVALCLSLIVCDALVLERYSRLADIKDGPAMARALRPGVEWAPNFSKSRLRWSGALGGAICGAAMLWFLSRTDAGRGVGAAVTFWSVAIAALLGAMFVRGVELTRTGTRHGREALRTGLIVDLLRIDRLYPFGRAAGRTAIIWFAVSAATLLLLVGTELAVAMAVLSILSAALGVWVFVGTLAQVRQAIRAAKLAELEQVRHQIAALKADLHSDPAAPAKLQSLLAYEARIDAVHEWPFDQTTLVRVSASSLVLALPWFGQAFAGALVQRFSAMIR